MQEQNKEERLLEEISRLVASIDRLVEAGAAKASGECGPDMASEAMAEPPDDAVSAEAAESAPRAATQAVQQVFLGLEVDQCSGSLSVRNRSGQWIPVQRGRSTRIDVAIDGNGYWYWRCGSTGERSRGEPNYRPRVKRLYVYHSTNDRKITWRCYDLL